MKQTVDTGSDLADGLGIFATSLPCGRFWGHVGGILDYGTYVFAGDDGRRVAVVSERGFTGAEAQLSRLLCPARTTAAA
jgi:hypothetical protein